MCGITGIFDTRGKRDIDRAVLHRMNESQFHRGPDEGGLHIEPGVGLGHRRLSIIDLSTGQQPLYNEDQSICVVFNGEIYNYQELIPELQALGHIFHTRSDTEVIVHAWEAWGESCVDRFRGMFAFSLWDRTVKLSSWPATASVSNRCSTPCSTTAPSFSAQNSSRSSPMAA